MSLTMLDDFHSATPQLRRIAGQGSAFAAEGSMVKTRAAGHRSRQAYQRIKPVEKYDTPAFEGKYFIIVSAAPENEIEQIATDLGASVFPVSSLNHAQRVLAESPNQWDAMLVLRDGLMPLDHLVTELLSLRFARRDLPVVLFSSSFQADDLGTSRSPISDASMVMPLTHERLKWGIGAALTNHMKGL